MDSHDAIKKVAEGTFSVCTIVAKLLGVVEPTAATVGVIADSIQKRRSQKFARRLEKFALSLDRRVRKIEDETQIEKDVDLLDEIIAKAISDEDEEKTEYYVSLIEYYTSQSISPHEVRLLSNAFKSLLVSEIKGFAGFVTGQNILKDVHQDLVSIFWNRVQFLGLYKGGSGTAKHASQVTHLGKQFVEIVKLVPEVNSD